MSHIVSAAMFTEACYPLGDATHSRDLKRKAVRAVMIDQLSYRSAAKLVNVPHTTVARWCDEFEERIRTARDWAEKNEPLGVP